MFAAVALVLVGVVGAFWLDSDDAGQQKSVSTEWQQIQSYSSSHAAVAREKAPFPAAEKVVSANFGQERNNPGFHSDEVLVNPRPEGGGNYSNREVQARLAQVADVYAEQIKYPTFSMPIPDRQALQKYLPNRSFDAERPLEMEDENSPRIRLQTDKHQYFSGDIIQVTVGLSGFTDDPWVAVQARLVAGEQTLATTDAGVAGPQVATYRMSFADLDGIPASGMAEYRIVARININGEEYELGTPVSYVESVAEVTNVGTARVSGEYLYIPVSVTTSKPGYHELDANLYGGQSGKPLVHLSAQQELQSTNGLMQLQAHVAALKAGGDPGPYVLQDIDFTRMPSSPDFATEYGSSSQDAYVVNGYAFEEYADVPYVDEEARKRLEFLRRLGNAN